uniref:MotA/TolQ/ExbB proton channel family protein n=1 Tax=Candidatus Kentrum sp. TUN TaxID=2126343 RepID=A0A451A1K9_9GAMM|nr:MAG: hypothetical protein BECKTUN1418D_GA0071000_102220 [Candidatus Kentron sp. TUN]VFK59912.1 MAG: hypothetical protein BECKTUN1418F_GA0071002_11912 [Candidatus Kentron sp. TUN]VFK68915.1 MAG: hypothetical protein BECKTUN1418E_GA0071001_11892 [Candidatus Kentron sp. TUN]
MVEYTKYLYEEEKERTEKFHSATKIYLFFIASTIAGLGGVLQWFGLKPLHLQQSGTTIIEMVVFLLLISSSFTLVLSFIFASLILKGWQVERLYYPKKFITLQSMILERKNLMEAILSIFHHSSRA